jgi:GTP-binding protein HflX
VWISARDRAGLELLRDALGHRLGLRRIAGEVQLPPGAGRLRARLHELGAVLSEHHDEDGWVLSLDLAEADAARIASHAYGEPLRPLLVEAQGTPT